MLRSSKPPLCPAVEWQILPGPLHARNGMSFVAFNAEEISQIHTEFDPKFTLIFPGGSSEKQFPTVCQEEVTVADKLTSGWVAGEFQYVHFTVEYDH